MMCYYLNVHFQGQRVNLITRVGGGGGGGGLHWGGGAEGVKSFLPASTPNILYCMVHPLKGHKGSTRMFGVERMSAELVSVVIYRLYWNSLVSIVARLQAGLFLVI
jgi:hypothetical protein